MPTTRKAGSPQSKESGRRGARGLEGARKGTGSFLLEGLARRRITLFHFQRGTFVAEYLPVTSTRATLKGIGRITRRLEPEATSFVGGHNFLIKVSEIK